MGVHHFHNFPGLYTRFAIIFISFSLLTAVFVYNCTCNKNQSTDNTGGSIVSECRLDK